MDTGRRAGQKKKKTPEEIRAYNRERQRQRRKKFTDEQLEAKRKYDRKYKEEKKEKGLWKKISDRTPREARKIRRQTRDRTRRCRENKKKIECNTENEPDNTYQGKKGSSRKAIGRKKKVLSRTKVYLDLLKTKKREHIEKKRAERYKKKYLRLLKKFKAISTPSPSTKVSSLCGKVKIPTPVKRKLIFSDILTTHLEKKRTELKGDQKKLQEFSKIVSPEGLKKHKMIGKASPFISYKLYKKALNNKGRKKSLKNINNAIIVRNFLELDINSRMCPGKKETVTKNKVKRQKRILLDTLKNLHLKFLREYNIKMSYTLFRQLRPYHVVRPKMSDRDTCLCIDHANIKLIIDKLYYFKIISTNSLTKLAEMACCSTKNKSCMYRQCSKCSTKLTMNVSDENIYQPVLYRQWAKKREDRLIKNTMKSVSLTIKVSITCTLNELIDAFWQKFNNITRHMFDINHQFLQMKYLRKTMTDKETIIHMDFSENYCTKYFSEPQALHFGASKKQLSLHTIVCYGNMFPSKVQSYCTVSSNLDHASFGVWAHLTPVLKEIANDYPEIDTIHFQSDGPSSQYKNKSNVYLLINKLPEIFPIIKQWTWNFSISGHGKGPMDGIGGTVKRTADQVVLHGEDVTTTEDVINKVGPLCPKIKLIVIHSDEFEKWKSQLIANPPPVKGIQQVHQILWQNKHPFRIEIRSLSCARCKFKFCKHFNLLTDYVSFKSKVPDVLRNNEQPAIALEDQQLLSFNGQQQEPEPKDDLLQFDNLPQFLEVQLHVSNENVPQLTDATQSSIPDLNFLNDDLKEFRHDDDHQQTSNKRILSLIYRIDLRNVVVCFKIFIFNFDPTKYFYHLSLLTSINNCN